MININDCSIEHRRFIKSMPSNFIYGIPIKLVNDTYYPINHEKLFLRYYVSYSGYIYDAFNNITQKYSMDDEIKFTSIDNQLLIVSLKEIIWLTFYRFPERKDSPIDKPLDYKPVFINAKNGVGEYVIDGVSFRYPKFPINSKIYDELINISKYKIVVSENGAIYNVKSKRFIMIHQDDDGYPFIYSKSNTKIRINEIIAYTWYPEIYDVYKYNLVTAAFSEIFVSKDNLILYDLKNKSISNTGHHFQNLGVSHHRPNGFSVYDEKYYSIPIHHFYRNLKISINGAIITRNKTILKPYKIIYCKRTNSVHDVYYKVPSTNKVFSIIDIYLWSVYRLTRDSIYILNASFELSKEGIPLISDIYVVTKTRKNAINGYTGFYFGNEWFNLMTIEDTIYHNYYISKRGAIFYTKENIFIPYNLSSIDSNVSTSIPTEKTEKWINLRNVMINSWVGSLPSTRLFSVNGIPSDISIYNIKIHNTNKSNEDIKSYLLENVNRICGSANIQELTAKCQIPEIIE